ncbi:ABC transporter permease [Fulvimarina endophytica]|uniref:ABC transporter permease n=1 Tax=Fulvimarina endophytica TaxID=2293836 RepID=A0A371X5R5_9HYPH|nr:ABC transporter permease [Fulvimarina endophytica]
MVEARAGERQTPIVPPGNVAGRALVITVAIMTFLASLTIGAVSLVSKTAAEWQNDISREITVQVIPREGLDMDAALSSVEEVARATSGVTAAARLTDSATSRLLEPWLGGDLSLDELPVPRLVVVSIDAGAPPDFDALRTRLQSEVPEARLDDHRAWVSRLVAMASAMILTGIGVLVLVLVATTLTVVFATRGAMAGNKQIVEVLHFVGARSEFIAAQFQTHFLRMGLIGALFGGSAAVVLFWMMGLWTESNQARPEADQISALFGSFAIGWSGYLGVAFVIVLVGGLTALTSRFTVVRQLSLIDMLSPVEN